MAKSTEEVVGHHLQSFGAGDVDAMMEDYTQDSVIVTPTDTLKGLDAIRALFDVFTTQMLPPGCTFEMLRQEIEGEVAYIFWNAESETHKFLAGSDTFIVKDGKIAMQTFAAHIELKG
jgi:ketosteroid isomerase-like protein